MKPVIDIGFYITLFILGISSSGSDPVFGLELGALLGVSIYLHEAGHYLAFQKLGFGVGDIHLTFMGGYTPVRSGGGSNRDLFLGIAAGPAVTLLIWFLLRNSGSSLLGVLAVYNYYFLLFNLLPVGGLDGGRIRDVLLDQYVPSGQHASYTIALAVASLGAVFAFGGGIVALVLVGAMAYQDIRRHL